MSEIKELKEAMLQQFTNKRFNKIEEHIGIHENSTMNLINIVGDIKGNL